MNGAIVAFVVAFVAYLIGFWRRRRVQRFAEAIKPPSPEELATAILPPVLGETEHIPWATFTIPDPPSCGVCRFFKTDIAFGGLLGTCRLHSPITGQREGTNDMGRWPKVYDRDWCGDFERAIRPVPIPPPDADATFAKPDAV